MIKRLLTLILLLSVSGLALATSAYDDTLDPAAVHDYTDKSVYYLSQIFGTVGGVLTGQGSQMMGQIFYKLNWGIFLVSGIVVLYAVVLGAVRLASEGITIAQGKSSLFTLIKLAVGVSLVIPNSGTGYSLLQNLVMQVVVKGVGLADSVWNYGLDYLSEGGVIWSAPSANAATGNSRYDGIITDENESALIGANANTTALATQIFTNAVCMMGSRDPLTSSSSSDNRPYYDVQVDQDKYQYRFPGLTDKDLSGSSCGTVSWNVKNACDVDSQGKLISPVSCSIAQGSMASLIDVLLPAAKSYYCMTASSDSQVCATGFAYDNLDDDLSPVLFNSMMNYYPSIKSYADMQLSSMTEDNKNFIANAETEGWLMAGRYYWNVMQFVSNTDETSNLSNYTNAKVTLPSQEALGASDKLKTIVNNAAGDFSSVADSTAYDDYVNSVYTQVGETSSSTSGSGDIIDNDDAVKVIAATGVAPGVAGTFAVAFKKMDAIGDMFKSFDSENYNPIGFMYKLGKKCLEVTKAIWIYGGLMIGANVLAGSICSASNPYGYAVQAIADWVKPILMMVAGAFWVSGFFLSYYVPLYPYIIFLFASIGWFVSVIEAMVAAPLVALGLTHPEDHDFLGKAQQAVMLLLSVFLQPALLVVGLIAGMIFSYVSFELLIYSFSGFIVDIMRDSSQLTTSTNMLGAVMGSKLYEDAGILIQPLLLVVFCMISYVLLTQCYSLIHVLRDNVMRWIGVQPNSLPNPEQLAGEVKGAVTGYGKQTGDAGSQSASAASGRSTLEAGSKIKKSVDGGSPEDAGSSGGA